MSTNLREATTDADILAAWPIMRELRPHLTEPATFAERVWRQQRDGYRLLAAWDADTVVGLAGWRVLETLIRGRFCYVDDLVVQADARRGRLGERLLDGVAEAARALGLAHLVLDTGIDNVLGQRFYFRYGMLPGALRFAMPIEAAPTMRTI
jgi:ribosomal protein S18 acetylase RimI-like enzyme